MGKLPVLGQAGGGSATITVNVAGAPYINSGETLALLYVNGNGKLDVVTVTQNSKTTITALAGSLMVAIHTTFYKFVGVNEYPSAPRYGAENHKASAWIMEESGDITLYS